MGFSFLDFAVQIPLRLLQVLEWSAFMGGAGDIFNGVAKAKAQVPRLDYLDRLINRVASIMGWVVYRFGFLFHRRRFWQNPTRNAITIFLCDRNSLRPSGRFGRMRP